MNLGLFSDTDDNEGFRPNNPHLSHNGHDYYGNPTDSDYCENICYYQNGFSRLSQVDPPKQSNISNSPYGSTSNDDIYDSYYCQNDFSHFHGIKNTIHTTDVNENSYSSNIYSDYTKNQEELVSSNNYCDLLYDKDIQSDDNLYYNYSNNITQTTENIADPNSCMNEPRVKGNYSSEGSDTEDNNGDNTSGTQTGYQNGYQTGYQNAAQASIGTATIVSLGVSAMTQTRNISITENNFSQYTNIQGDNIEPEAVFGTVVHKGQIEHQDIDVGVGVSNAEFESNKLAGNIKEVLGTTSPDLTITQSNPIEAAVGKVIFPKHENFIKRSYRVK